MPDNAYSLHAVSLGSASLLTGDHFGATAMLPVRVQGTPQDVACVGQAWGKVKDRKARFTSLAWRSSTLHADHGAAALAALTWLAALPTTAGECTVTVDGGSFTIADAALVNASAVPDGRFVRYECAVRGGALAAAS